VLLNRLLRRRSRLEVPSIVEIIMRTTALSSIVNQRRLVEGLADLYLQPPVEGFQVEGFQVMEHERGAEIAVVGYDYAREAVEAWMRRRAA
jgi:hypothetical protein